MKVRRVTRHKRCIACNKALKRHRHILCNRRCVARWRKSVGIIWERIE